MPDPIDALPDPVAAAWWDFRRSLVRRGRSDGTAAVYRKAFLAFWRWALDNGIAPDPSAVDHRVINRWTDALLEQPATRNGRPQYVTDPDTGERVPKLIEPSTRRILYANLRPFFSWWSHEVDTVNPFDRADPPATPKDGPVPIVPRSDIAAILSTCSDRTDFTDTRDAALIRLLIDTGARRGEVTGIAVEDWDRRHDLLRLDGKSGPRVVSLSPSTGEALARYLRNRARHPKADNPALWLGAKGPLTDSGVAQILRRRCELAGVPHINPHRLRHTWAHIFRAEGGSEGDLMYLAGWTSTEMAHRYGRSAQMERAQQTAKRIRVGDLL